MNTKIALITGGSRGLGKSAAMKLGEQGVDVIITYRSKEKEAADVVAAIEAAGGKAAALQLDVGNTSSFAAFAASLRAGLASRWQRDSIDFLVNNAGVAGHASIADTTEAQFDELFNVHLKGVFFLTQQLAPMVADGGRILNVSSGLTRFTLPGFGAYAAMKGAVEVLTSYLAQELGGRGIAVNVIAPGAVETDFGGGMVRDNAELNGFLASQTALGRVGQPDDIGGAVASLLSDNSRWLNGQRVEASGGMFL